MKVLEVLKLLEDDGWYWRGLKAVIVNFKQPIKLGTVTVSGKRSVEMPRGTLNSILKQAGLKSERGSK